MYQNNNGPRIVSKDGKYVLSNNTSRKELQNDDGTVSNEMAICMGPEQAAELADRLRNIADSNGELGVRVVFYTSPRTNKRTGEPFEGTNILVQPKTANPNGGNGFQKRGGFNTQQPRPQQQGYAQQGTYNPDGNYNTVTPSGGQTGNGMIAPQTAYPSKPPVKQSVAPKRKPMVKAKPPQQEGLPNPEDYTEDNSIPF